MKILSLFDGISCARVALERAGIPVELYWAVEIDKYATQISAKNYPNIIRTSDVRAFIGTEDSFDLLIGGSPCQDLSIAKKDRKGLDGERSGLFWEYVRILNEVKPKYFILENVNSMPKEAKQLITETLGVEPIMIDAALVSAQRRKRLFWVGKWNGEKYEQVIIPLPEDRRILLKDILEDTPENDLPLKEKSNTIRTGGRGSGAGDKHEWDSVYQYRRTYMGTGGNNVPYVPVALRNRGEGKKPKYNGTGKANALTTVRTDSMVARATVQKNAEQYSNKCPALTASMGMGGGNEPLLMNEKRASELKGKYIDGEQRKIGIRKLTTLECTRLQSLPDGYVEAGVSNTQKYKALGNAFNVAVVAHILKHICV